MIDEDALADSLWRFAHEVMGDSGLFDDDRRSYEAAADISLVLGVAHTKGIRPPSDLTSTVRQCFAGRQDFEAVSVIEQLDSLLTAP